MLYTTCRNIQQRSGIEHVKVVWQQVVVFEMGGRGWTELAKETPGFRSYLTATPATLYNFATLCDCTR